MRDAERVFPGAAAGADASAVIFLDLPMRTPTLNVWQRMHWARRKRLGKELAWHIKAGKPAMPDRPLARCRIRVERESTQEPDKDGLYGGLKPLLDALQPHSKAHPYGMGLIADDSPKCVLELTATHVHGKGSNTRVWIEPA